MRSTILTILLVFSLASCAQTEKKSVLDKFNYEGIGKPVFTPENWIEALLIVLGNFLLNRLSIFLVSLRTVTLLEVRQ